MTEINNTKRPLVTLIGGRFAMCRASGPLLLLCERSEMDRGATNRVAMPRRVLAPLAHAPARFARYHPSCATRSTHQ